MRMKQEQEYQMRRAQLEQEFAIRLQDVQRKAMAFAEQFVNEELQRRQSFNNGSYSPFGSSGYSPQYQ
jgi:hypothetical protein